jgi:hypothetical protein
VLDGTVVTGNTADDLGAGLYFDVCHGDSNVTIVNSVVSNNTSTGSGGGGIWFDEGNTLTIQNSTLSGNHAAYRGGALYFDDGTSLVVISSTLSDNHAGEGERQSGWGGAIVLSRLTGDALIANSTISGNTVTGFGGGIAVLSGNLDLEQATISGNTATSGGDGLYFGYGGDETATSAARQRQGASGPSAQDAESGAITGSIVAGNGDGSEDLSSDFNGGFPVDATSSVLGGTSFVNVSGEGNQTGVTNPGLAPLANNGGPTQTMALLAGSPAIDAGPATVPDFPGNEFDQRGPGFPRVVNGKVDVGAYEVQPAPAPAPAPEVVVTPKFTG